MLPWIVAAAVLVIAYVVYTSSRGKGGTKGEPPGLKPKRLETTIFVTAGPTVPEPVALRGCEGDQVVWRIESSIGPVEVWIPNFKHDGNPGVRDPLEGPNAGRKNPPGQTTIRDRIKRGAQTGRYKYDIYVNGKLALDPDLEVIV